MAPASQSNVKILYVASTGTRYKIIPVYTHPLCYSFKIDRYTELAVEVDPLLGDLWQTSHIFSSQVSCYMIHVKVDAEARVGFDAVANTCVTLCQLIEAPVPGLSDGRVYPITTSHV